MDSQAIIIHSDHFLLLRLLKGLRGPNLEIGQNCSTSNASGPSSASKPCKRDSSTNVFFESSSSELPISRRSRRQVWYIRSLSRVTLSCMVLPPYIPCFYQKRILKACQGDFDLMRKHFFFFQCGPDRTQHGDKA